MLMDKMKKIFSKVKDKSTVQNLTVFLVILVVTLIIINLIMYKE